MLDISSSKREKMKNILYYILTTALVLLFLAPLYWMVASSLKPEQEIFRNMNNMKAFLIENFTLINYPEALKAVPMLRYIWNSMFSVSLITILGLVVNSLCGYGLAKLKIPGKKYIIAAILALIIIPSQSILLPLYLIVFKMGMINKFDALVVPFIANCFNIYLFHQFFGNIPKELEEAAYIDGANVLKIFLKIIIPLSKPVFATVAILTFSSYWSDFLWPLIVTNDASTRTVQVGLQMFFTDPPWNYANIMAALTLGTIPMVIIFLAFQKYYVQGIASSGIKG